MTLLSNAILAFAAISVSLDIPGTSAQLSSSLITCQQIAEAVSGESQVFYAPTIQYSQGVSHWASSSSEVATCVVEPGTAVDVGKILQIVGQQRTPFAVKGGGHTSNVHFSSTTGVQISMTRFNQVTYSAASQTAEIGAGLVWDDVYAALEPHGVSVVGGRVSGVGVAGFTLGGGYSWKSNQYGLTVDTIVAYELVEPNGTVRQVTASDTDLFFALKGGFNNFGIVTKFVLRTFPQTQVYGGYMVFTEDKYPQILNATERFTNGVGQTDPKAAMLINLNTVELAPISTIIMFYDGPTPPAGTFDDFLNIPGAVVSDVKTRSFLSLVQATPASTEGLRGAFEVVSTTGYNMAMLHAIANETLSLISNLVTTLQSDVYLNFAIEPFHPSLFSHNTPSNGAGGDSAYPPTRTRVLFPLNLYFAWTQPTFDDLLQHTITTSARKLEQVAGSLGLLPPGGTDEAWLYGNYAITGTPVERIYGGNLPRLQGIKAAVDPGDVMGLTGGWKV